MKKIHTGTGTQINRFQDLQSNQSRYPDLYYYCYCEPILPMIVMYIIQLLYYIVSVCYVHICQPRVSKILRFISLPLHPFVSVRLDMYTADCVIQFIVRNTTRHIIHNASIVYTTLHVMETRNSLCAVKLNEDLSKGKFLIVNFSTNPSDSLVFFYPHNYTKICTYLDRFKNKLLTRRVTKSCAIIMYSTCVYIMLVICIPI